MQEPGEGVRDQEQTLLAALDKNAPYNSVLQLLQASLALISVLRFASRCFPRMSHHPSTTQQAGLLEGDVLQCIY
jgi:hypothetical protein